MQPLFVNGKIRSRNTRLFNAGRFRMEDFGYLLEGMGKCLN